MKVTVMFRAQVNGRIVRKGDVIDIDENEFATRRFIYKPVDESFPQPDIKPSVMPLTKAQVQARLDELNIPYGARMSLEKLNELLGAAQGNHPAFAGKED